MDFPQGSHIHKQAVVEDNASLLEEHLKKVDWRYLIQMYLGLWSVLLFSVFSLIAVIRLALMIF